MAARPRIAIAGFQHETNTFSPLPAQFEDFEKADGWPGLTRGSRVLQTFAPLNIPIGGAINAAAETDLVPVLWASAEPSGYVADEAFETIADMLLEGVSSAGDLDGIYLDLHGAMVTRSHEDGEGELLRRVRALVGNDLPIAVSLDLHANVTAQMVDNASVLAIFRTYPHLDMAETGARAFGLLHRMLETGAPFEKAFGQFPFLLPLSAQSTDVEPARELYGLVEKLSADGPVTCDVALGFPPADIHDCGPSVVAYGADAGSASATADALLERAIALRDAFDNTLVTPRDGVRRAVEIGRPGAPALLADVQDNPGAGATADTTDLLAALVEGGARGAVLGLMWDPEAAAAAHAAGVGSEISLALGGRFGPQSVEPLSGRFVVEAVSDGVFPCTGEMYAGVTANLGPTALLRIVDASSEVRVAVSTERCQCVDQAMLAHLGVEPSQCAIVALKSTVHYRADFAPIAGEIVLVEAPGYNHCRLDKIAFEKVRAEVRP
jgi:microcystin degradation protein MlrC